MTSLIPVSNLPRLSSGGLDDSVQLHTRRGSRDYRTTLSDLKTKLLGNASSSNYWSGTTTGDTITGLVNLPSNRSEDLLIIVGGSDVSPNEYTVDRASNSITFSPSVSVGVNYSIRSLVSSRFSIIFMAETLGAPVILPIGNVLLIISTGCMFSST